MGWGHALNCTEVIVGVQAVGGNSAEILPRTDTLCSLPGWKHFAELQCAGRGCRHWGSPTALLGTLGVAGWSLAQFHSVCPCIYPRPQRNSRATPITTAPYSPTPAF